MTGFGIPWVTEVDLWRGMPKTARIPTGGWRGLGAVPSHSYPYESTLPEGYWSGLGMVASVAHPDAQQAKSWRGLGGFGQITAATAKTAADWRLLAAEATAAKNLTLAAAYEAKAKEIEAAAPSAWEKTLQQVMTAGGTALSAWQQYQIQRDMIKAGMPPTAFVPGATPAPAGAAPTAALMAGGGGMGTLFVVAAIGIGALLFLRR